jgi:4-amino-4-deoxy-L-arabinose transferase-like glycosyltransferase
VDPEPKSPAKGTLRRPRGAHPLAALLLVVAFLGLTWAILVPPWQSPDETWHFAYAQSLAERFALPGAPSRRAYSSDLSLALNAVHGVSLAFHPEQVSPDWSETDEALYLRQAGRASRSDGGGFNIETANPPLFYLLDDLPYLAASAGSAFARLYAMRVCNVGLLLLTVVGAWLLAGEVFGRRRLAQLACASGVGLIPMQTFIGTSVNPDALIIPEWTLALWLGVRVIRQGQLRDAVILCALTAAAILTKASSYALIPPVLVALVLGWSHRPRAHRRAAAPAWGAALLALVVPVLAWVGLTQALQRPTVNVITAAPGAPPHPFTIGGFFSYLARFYIPKLPLLSGHAPLFHSPVYETWVRGAWGEFGWLDVSLPSGAYKLLAEATAAVALLALAHLVRFRDRRRLALVAFFAVALLSLLTLLHISDYRSILAGSGPLAQGRYLLPLSALFGLALGLVLLRLRPRWQGAFCALIIGAGLALQLMSLAVVARSYYA